MVRLSGTLDASAVLPAQRSLASLQAVHATALVFDLEGLEFIDTGGITMLLSTRLDAARRGCTVSVTNVSRRIQRVFDFVGALPGVRIFGSMAEFDAYLRRLQSDD